MPQQAADGCEHVLIQLDDKTVFFKQGDEFGGRQKTVVRALPAHQRLPSGQLQAVQAVFGLDVNLEFFVAQGLAHAHFQFLFAQDPDAHAGIIEVPGRRALGLDGLEGDIGAVQQIVDAGGRVAVLRAADARAQLYMVAPGLGTHVSIERTQQRVAIGRQFLLFVVGKQNHEMVPALSLIHI